MVGTAGDAVSWCNLQLAGRCTLKAFSVALLFELEVALGPMDTLIPHWVQVHASTDRYKA